MKKIQVILFICMLMTFGACYREEVKSYKPVLYLYPEERTAVDVSFAYNGELTSTYPLYEDGWHVIADSDGTLHALDSDKSYYCLFWEGINHFDMDISHGFVIKGEDTKDFLEDALAKLGLNDREMNEFIIYWLPKLETNPYNLISFQNESYTDHARLMIEPTPDTVIRIHMAWKKLDSPISVSPQELETVERKGFTVVEWGGTELR